VGPHLRRAGGRLLGGPGRVPGIDVARGIAVLGMFTAHIGVMSDDWTGSNGWLNVAHGRSSILFATVAGLSLALISGRAEPFTGAVMSRVRSRILIRAVCLLVVGLLLEALGTRVYVILGFYAVYFALAVPVLGWPVRRLVGTAAVVAVVGPPLVYWGPEALVRAGIGADDVVTHYLLSGHYPAVVWMAYVLMGLAIGRSAALTSARVRIAMIVGGAGIAAVSAAASSLLVGADGGADAVRTAIAATSTGVPGSAGPPVSGLFLSGPHDDTLLEVVGSGGFAVAVIGLCLCVGRIGARALAPLAAVGSMALTVYTLQIVAIWRWNLLDVTSNDQLVVMTLVSLAGATAWRATLGRGPFERIVARIATSATATR
jgi:uncharacterized membrane protein YeiB